MRSFSPVLALFCLSAISARAATLTWDCTRVPNICSNDCYAIQCLGRPSTLHRDSADASANRAKTACKSPNRCSGGDSDHNSCGKFLFKAFTLLPSSILIELFIADEYPYASSQEGGSSSVTRCVSSTENSRQGGTLSSFYSANDLVDGDAYNVAFTNTGGLQYCGGSCTNTGNEVLSRRASSVADIVGTQHIPKKFVTDSGHELISMLIDATTLCREYY